MDCVIESGQLIPASRHYDDPGQALDYIAGALILVCTIPFVVGNVAMVWFRDYPPIRSKSVVLTVVSSCGGLTWVAAAFVVFDQFMRKRKSTVSGICSLWFFWLQACFGFALWLSCFIVRLYNLRLILILKRGAIKHVMAALLVLLSPIVIYSVLTSSLRATRFVVQNNLNQPMVLEPRRIDHHPQGECKVSLGWEIGIIIILLLYFAVFIGLAVSLRNVRPQYNEFRLIRNGGIFTFFLFLLNLVTYHTKVYREVTGRCFLTIIQSGAVYYYFWARNLEVVYNVLFNKEQYLENFRAQMNSVPLTGQSCDPNPLENLFYEVRDQVASAQVEVQELEHTLAKLQEQYKQEWSWGNVDTIQERN